MNWQTLKVMECPRCGSPLKEGMLGYKCSQEQTRTCRFQISYEKFSEVVKDLYQPKAPILYDPDAVDRTGWDLRD